MIALLLAAQAYEVDAWTPRKWQLGDATPSANLYFDTLLDEAISRTPCEGSDERVRRQLAREIARATARRVWLDDRRGLARMGHGVYSGWLESDEGVERVTTGSEGVFRDVGWRDGFVLSTAGTASTVNLGGELVGTDKIDHFLATGHTYFRWSDEGEDPERAMRRGARTERTLLGQWTSKAFSYGDLAANYDGYRFYRGLLEPDSIIQRGVAGCPVRVGTWDWARWVQRDWDEYFNPSVYSRRVARRLAWTLEPEQDAVCADWEPVESRVMVPHRVPRASGPVGLVCDPATDPVSAGPSPTPPEIKVATVNVHGLPWPLTRKRARRLETVRSWIEEEGFDLVAIQEAWRGGRQHLGDVSKPAGRADSGLALYTEQPHENLAFVPFDEAAGFDRWKTKGVWWSRVTLEGAEWVVGVVHLQSGKGSRAVRARQAQVEQVLGSAPLGRVLLLGDFNLHRGVAGDVVAAEQLAAAGFTEVSPLQDSGTSEYGTDRFDRVYVRGAPNWTWAAGRTWRAFAPSDHYPVSTQLRSRVRR